MDSKHFEKLENIQIQTENSEQKVQVDKQRPTTYDNSGY